VKPYIKLSEIISLLEPGPPDRIQIAESEADRKLILGDVQEEFERLESMGFRTAKGSSGHILAEYDRQQHDTERYAVNNESAMSKLKRKQTKNMLRGSPLSGVRLSGFAGSTLNRQLELYPECIMIDRARTNKRGYFVPESLGDAILLRDWLDKWIAKNKPESTELDCMEDIEL